MLIASGLSYIRASYSSLHRREKIVRIYSASSGVMRERKQRGSETKTYILTKAVGMAYGDNGPLFTKLLGAVGGIKLTMVFVSGLKVRTGFVSQLS